MAAVHQWVRGNRIIAHLLTNHLLERLFMLPRHSRQYTPSFVPDPSLGPRVPDILVRPRIDICSINAFPILGFFLDSFALFRYLIDELMIWT
jgi:hypothetical protein